MSLSKASEKKYLHDLTNSFYQYAEWNNWFIDNLQEDFQHMSAEWQALVPSFPDKIMRMRSCVTKNQAYLAYVAEQADALAGPAPKNNVPKQKPSSDHMEKLSSILRQSTREWSKEGELERSQSFGPLLHALEETFPDKSKRSELRVLVPGCGLCRLPWEIAKRGFRCEANEYTYFMLLPARAILSSERPGQHQIFPWATEPKNAISADLQCREVLVPDVDPNSLTPGPGEPMLLTLSAGSWLEIYGGKKDKHAWNAIVTCFFIDTASNVLSYLQHIADLLVKGGTWINLGPLLYHYGTADQKSARVAQHFRTVYSGNGTQKAELMVEQSEGPGDAHKHQAEADSGSIELSYEELKGAMPAFGFRMIEEKLNIHCSYSQDQQSLKQRTYQCVYFKCVKE